MITSYQLEIWGWQTEKCILSKQIAQIYVAIRHKIEKILQCPTKVPSSKPKQSPNTKSPFSPTPKPPPIIPHNKPKMDRQNLDFLDSQRIIKRLITRKFHQLLCCCVEMNSKTLYLFVSVYDLLTTLFMMIFFLSLASISTHLKMGLICLFFLWEVYVLSVFVYFFIKKDLYSFVQKSYIYFRYFISIADCIGNISLFLEGIQYFIEGEFTDQENFYFHLVCVSFFPFKLFSMYWSFLLVRELEKYSFKHRKDNDYLSHKQRNSGF